MIIIADSGSTKTDWYVFSKQGKDTFESIGLNPYFLSSEEIGNAIGSSFPESIKEQAKQIFFYGAGCSSKPMEIVVFNGLKSVFSNASIEVNHDLLGAARACCLHEPGIACILGTGSNSCYYDGKEIKDNVASLAYILGDEGSGGFIGKRLIRAYFYRQMPKDLAASFFDKYQLTKDGVLDAVYLQKKPNTYLASFATFASEHRQHPFIQQLLTETFDEFLESNIKQYEKANRLPIHFVGSIAFHFQDELTSLIKQKGWIVGSFIKKPIDRLCEFHSNIIPKP